MSATAVVPTSTLNPCTCPDCHTTIAHWRCDNCGSGPWRFSPHVRAAGPAKAPYGARQYNDASGQAAGRRYWCSKLCQRAEERVYLVSQLDLAHARRDVNAARIITGRLQELDRHDVHIPTLTESMYRGPQPLPQPEPEPTTTEPVATAEVPPAPEGADRDPSPLELSLLDIDGTPLDTANP